MSKPLTLITLVALVGVASAGIVGKKHVSGHHDAGFEEHGGASESLTHTANFQHGASAHENFEGDSFVSGHRRPHHHNNNNNHHHHHPDGEFGHTGHGGSTESETDHNVLAIKIRKLQRLKQQLLIKYQRVLQQLKHHHQEAGQGGHENHWGGGCTSDHCGSSDNGFHHGLLPPRFKRPGHSAVGGGSPNRRGHGGKGHGNHIGAGVGGQIGGQAEVHKNDIHADHDRLDVTALEGNRHEDGVFHKHQVLNRDKTVTRDKTTGVSDVDAVVHSNSNTHGIGLSKEHDNLDAHSSGSSISGGASFGKGFEAGSSSSHGADSHF